MTNIAFVPQGLSGEGGAAAFEMCARGTGKEWKIAKAQTGALSAPCTTIHEQMRMRGHQVIDLLKIDIEGFEYGVLRDCIDRRIPIQQICVEFHHFFEDISPGETLRTMHLLKRAGFTLIHKHMCDMTFYRL
jgi:FkbM family methyltransferase